MQGANSMPAPHQCAYGTSLAFWGTGAPSANTNSIPLRTTPIQYAEPGSVDLDLKYCDVQVIARQGSQLGVSWLRTDARLTRLTPHLLHHQLLGGGGVLHQQPSHRLTGSRSLVEGQEGRRDVEAEAAGGVAKEVPVGGRHACMAGALWFQPGP
jgi:hypothetical protein